MENEYQEYTEQAVEPEVVAPKKKGSLKKWLIIAAIVVVVAVAAFFIYNALTNTYKTPLNLEMKVKNAKTYSKYEKASQAENNGLFEKEQKAMEKLMKKSEDYDADEEKDAFEERIENLKEKYGDDYKYSYKITSKEKIDKDDLKDIQKDYRDNGKSMLKLLEERYDDFDSDDWDELAEQLGLSRSDAKKYIELQKDMYKKMKSVKVTAGYELDVTYTITGSELDEPEEWDATITVYKVNGRWVMD